MIKLSSKEWLNAGINSDLFYVNEDGTIKVAQLTDAGAAMGAPGSFDRPNKLIEHQRKLGDPQWQAALAPLGYTVKPHSKIPGRFVLVNKNGTLIRGGVLDGVLNTAGIAAANNGIKLPGPAPVTPPVTPPSPDPSQTTATTPKPTDWARRAKLLGAGLAGGAAGYYGTGAIADAMKTNNNLKDPTRAQDFYRGAASLQQSVSPILGISKSLNKTVQEMMHTIAELQVQIQKTQPMMASPTLKRQNAIMSAAEAKNTLPSQGADYLPQ
jgi:hypothetical protein